VTVVASTASHPDHATIYALTSIWERVLKRSPIGPHDNFFELGGDSLLAIALSVEIKRQTGWNLPVRTLCDAPTVARLAAVLGEPAAPEFSSLVLVAPGNQEPPLFIAGSQEIAAQIQSRHPVYALQRKERGEDPNKTIEEMAQAYLTAIDERQPNGPYFLSGYCFDGLIMFEVAQRLLKRGDEVARLALIDTYPHRRYWKLDGMMKLYARRARFHLSALRKTSIAQVTPYLAGRYRALSVHLRERRKAFLASGTWIENSSSGPEPLGRDAFYVPRHYPRKLTFIQSKTQSDLASDLARLVWGKLVQTLEVHRIACDHTQMVTTNADKTAQCLSRIFNG
jgi:thioesterase domain-containing protein/acyl carrier protein